MPRWILDPRRVAVLLAALLLAAMPAMAQEDAVIGEIRVEGNRRIESATVRSYMLLEPGGRFDSEQIDRSLKTLFATGLFSDVLIEREGNDLVVKLTENPIINRVQFEGNRAIRTNRLEEETEAEPRSVFTRARVQQDVQRILEVYRRSGRFSASVSPEYVELDQNRVDLIFVISEGPKTGIRAVNFIGNETYSDARLRSVILTNVSRWWRLFDRNDNYDPDRMEYDRELLRQFYSDNGFADFRVDSAVASLTPDQQGFYVTFTLTEGERYEFGNIAVETGTARLPAALLRAVLPMKTGEMFKGSLIEQAVEALVFTAGSAGYSSVDIRPVVKADPETRTVDISFMVDEGPLIYVERIDISGNTRTLDKVIRREIQLNEGDAFNRVLLDSARTRLRSLRFFSEVNITELPGSRPDRTVVKVDLKEQETGALELSLGYSSVENFFVNFELTQTNLGGRGQYLNLSARYSTFALSSNIGFTEPRFLGSNISFGGNIYVTDYTYENLTGYSNFVTGFDVTARLPLSKRRQLGLTYRLRYDNLSVRDDYAESFCGPDDPLSAICAQSGARLTSAIGYLFSMDRRNDPIRPTKGFNLFFDQELSGLGGDIYNIRTGARASLYQGLPFGLVATLRGSIGYITGYTAADVRINDLFRKGGFTFRGFRYNGLGPREVLYNITVGDDGTESRQFVARGLSIGGKFFAVGTFEVSFPFPYIPEETGLSGGMFIEFGTVTGVDPSFTRSSPLTSNNQRWEVEDSGRIRASIGFTLYWDTQIGPLQFDFSTILAQENYDEIETFRFSTRTQF